VSADAKPGESKARPLYMKIVTDPGAADLLAALIMIGGVYVAGLAEREGSSAIRIPAKARYHHWLERAAGRIHRAAWAQAVFWRQVQRQAKFSYDLETYR
jgi:hypothetical protein